MFEIILFVTLLVLGFSIGTYVEARHYTRIRKQERELQHIPTLTTKNYPADKAIEEIKFVAGNCVVSVDYFKSFVATLKSLIGGRITVYETLVDRARREAVLRMKTQADGYDLIVNTRIETSPIGGEAGGNRGVISVEVYAYGTALRFADHARATT